MFQFLSSDFDYYSFNVRKDAKGNLNVYVAANSDLTAKLSRYSVHFNPVASDVQVYQTESDLNLGQYCADFIDSTHTLIVLTCLKNQMLHVFQRKESFVFVAHLMLPEGDSFATSSSRLDQQPPLQVAFKAAQNYLFVKTQSSFDQVYRLRLYTVQLAA